MFGKVKPYAFNENATDEKMLAMAIKTNSRESIHDVASWITLGVGWTAAIIAGICMHKQARYHATGKAIADVLDSRTGSVE